MSVEFVPFVRLLCADPLFCITVLLIVGVVFVNGWTDAPNAIATCVSTRCLRPQTAVFLSSIFNLIGVWVMTALNASVAVTVQEMVHLGDDPQTACVVLCAALFAIVVWATAAWAFGIPTSESHALIAGLTGACIALHNDCSGIRADAWGKVLLGLPLSVVVGFSGGWAVTRGIQRLFSHVDRTQTTSLFRTGQIVGAAAMSFMHGAQDGQKFAGILVLATAFSTKTALPSSAHILPWLTLLIAIVMSLGTCFGGYKIIKTVGSRMVKPERYQGFSADLAGAGCLLLASLFGLPVSTTHAKSCAIMGAGAAKRFSTVDLRVVKEMALAWVLTFPGCGAVGFLMTKLFLWII